MKATDLRILSDEELQGKLGDLREEIGRLRFRSATEEIKNLVQVRGMRRDIARIETVLTERRKGLHVEKPKG